jgi:hypothetical protein
MEGEGKITAMLAIFALVVGFAFYASNAIDATPKRAELAKLQDQVVSIKRSIETRGEALTAAKEATLGLKQTDQMLSQLENLDKNIKELKDAREAVLGEFVSAVQSARAAAVGLEAPQLRLGNGTTLTGGKIKSVSPTEVIFTHSLGIARVPFKNLPDDLKAKFRVGMVPMQKIDEDSLRASPVVVPNSTPLDLGPANARPKLSVLQAEIARYEQQLAQLDQARIGALSRATTPPRSSGKITSAGVEAVKANQEATAIQIQMNGVNKKLNDLRALLPTALPE